MEDNTSSVSGIRGSSLALLLKGDLPNVKQSVVHPAAEGWRFDLLARSLGIGIAIERYVCATVVYGNVTIHVGGKGPPWPRESIRFR